MIFDCFIYHNEIELLELRYHLLKDVVDQFVVVESNRTFQGNHREFVCEKSIREIGIPLDKFKIFTMDFSSYDSPDPRVIRFRERDQRDAVKQYLMNFSDDSFFIISDVDEIINPDIIPYCKKLLYENPSVIIKPSFDFLCETADTRLYLDDKVPVSWKEKAFICLKKHLINNSIDQLRMNMSNVYNMYPGENQFPWLIASNIPGFADIHGWHFSWMGNRSRQFEKIRSNAFIVDQLYYKSGLPENLMQIENNLPHNKLGYKTKKYNKELLPKIIFDLPRVKNFLLPDKKMKNNKTQLEARLEDYIDDPIDPLKNFWLAYEYDVLGQTAPAISFFLRAAEKTENIDLQYECLVRIAKCFDRQGSRKATTITMYQYAISLQPTRPEAYLFLAKLYEWHKDWQLCYHYSSLGLSLCESAELKTLTDLEYPGIYSLIFQKSLSGWWIGKIPEARKLLRHVATEYKDSMNEIYYNTIQSNLMRVGIGPESQSFKMYDRSKHDKLRFKFKDSEKIEKNYSQVLQDMFILSILQGKKNGRYLEIGSADPFHGNNTALLEKNYDWHGIGIEYKEKFIKDYVSKRKNPVLHANALEVDYEEILSKLAVNGTVDYLQLDCEPAKVTYDIMTKIPFEKYKFAVITFEHDHYVDMTGEYRKKSRDFLIERGYQLIVNDVSPDGESTFEDWWVHPDLVDYVLFHLMMSNDGKIKKIEDYFYNR